MSKSELFNNIDDKLLAKFKKYHLENPDVFKQFEKYSKRMINSGRKKYSAWSIVNIIRWNYDLVHEELFKINNDFIALYARLFIYYNYKYNGFFEFRTMKKSDRRESSEELYRKNKSN